MRGHPTSRISSSRSSSRSASKASCSCSRQRLRKARLVDQSVSSKARRAASMARCISASDPSATCPSTSSVAGLTFSNVLPESAATSLPSMSILVSGLTFGVSPMRSPLLVLALRELYSHNCHMSIPGVPLRSRSMELKAGTRLRSAVGEVTFADVRTAARGVASRLRSTDPPVTTLASLLPNGDHMPVALFGACWAGVSYAPLNFRLPEPAQAELLARLEPAARFDDSWMHGAHDGEPFVDEPSRPAVLLFTSGTSAAPKAAVLHHDNLAAYLFNTLEFGSASAEEAALIAVPPFHIAGVAAVLSSTYVGRRIVPMARFDAEDWLELAAAESVTHAFVVPTMLARIIATLEADPGLRPPALRSLAYGGARMPRPVLGP